MIKKLYKFFVVFFYSLSFMLFLTPIKAIEINNIQIKGNERISDETIILFSEFNIGNDITNNKLNQIIKNLYETNFFENVNVKVLDQALLITVVEAPIIDKVEFVGVKAEKIKESLLSFISLKSRSSYNEFLVSEDRKKITSYLRQIGFYFSNVSTVIENLDNNLVNVIHNIELGEKAKLKKLNLLVIKFLKIASLKV